MTSILFAFYTEQIKLNFKTNMAHGSWPSEVETKDLCWRMTSQTSITEILLRSLVSFWRLLRNFSFYCQTFLSVLWRIAANVLEALCSLKGASLLFSLSSQFCLKCDEYQGKLSWSSYYQNSVRWLPWLLWKADKRCVHVFFFFSLLYETGN